MKINDPAKRAERSWPRSMGLILILLSFTSGGIAQSTTPSASLSLTEALTSPVHGSVGAGAPFGANVVNGPMALPTLDPLGICYDAAGAVHGVATIYVVELNAGTTYLIDATNFTVLGTIPNPQGNAETTGITTDGTTLYWAVNGDLYSTTMNGTSPTLRGALALPGTSGQAADICLGPGGDLWVVDNVNDQYSQHSLADGSFLGGVISNPSGAGSFGNGIAFRTDCSLFEAPHGTLASAQVSTISTLDPSTGDALSATPVGSLGMFVNGIEAVATSPTSGSASLFVVENFTNSLYEIAAAPPCPLPSVDCHDALAGGESYSFETSPNLYGATPGFPINDTLQTTLSLITVSGETSPIADVDCRVELTHTFVGDLDVQLTSPGSGVTVHLHDSAGAGSLNLNVVYDDDGRSHGPPFAVGDAMRPAVGSMADFNGLGANGSWTLEVTDNFAGEDGTLDEWELAFRSPLGIPDNDPAGAAATIDVPATNPDQVFDLDVTVDVSHSAIGHLRAELTSPAGTTVRLHDQTGGSSDDIVGRYDDNPSLGGPNDGFGTLLPSGPGVLADFDGELVAGSWTLALTDSTAGQSGQLNAFDLLVCGIDCEPPTSLVCDSNCILGDANLSWTNPQTYSQVEVFRNGMLVASLPGTSTSFVDAGLAAGLYTYEVVASCNPGVGVATCTVYHSPLGSEEHIIFAGESPFGQIDSVSALRDALVANGETVLVIDELDWPCFPSVPSGTVIWLCLGTFPHKYTLSATDGVTLSSLLAGNRSIYIESGDAWGFDPPTAFGDNDGVEDGTADDGDNSFTGMVGLEFGNLNLSGLAAPYAQDQLGVEFTDQLLATGTTAMVPADALGTSAGVVWNDNNDGYATGVYYQTDDTHGEVICQSWEFGGYGGDQNALAALYRAALIPGPIPNPGFVRGNLNADASTNLLDAVVLLNYLFVPGSAIPTCLDSADVNDDGSVNLLDPVVLLNYLFVPGNPTPSSPFPGCGIDPTPMDGVGCVSFAACP